MKGSKQRRFPKKGFSILTLQLSPKEREDLAVVRRLMGGRTKAAATRAAIHRLRFLLEAEEDHKQLAFIDRPEPGVPGTITPIHFVM